MKCYAISDIVSVFGTTGRRNWQPTPVFLPGKFHGQRSLLEYSPWGHKETGMTEHTHTHSKVWCFFLN